jgi:putative addiction module killer protein
MNMYKIETTEEFDSWLDNISDGKTQKIIVKRIRIMSLGTLGKVRPLKNGLFEAKINYEPGFRLYYVNKGKKIIVLLCGGDKSTQRDDIKQARRLAKEI